MSERLEVNYNSNGNQKDSYYLPAIHLNILQSDTIQNSILQQDLPNSTGANNPKKRRATFLLVAIGSAAMLLFLFHRLSSPKEEKSTSTQIVSEEPQQTDVVSADSLLAPGIINPLLTEEAVNNGCVIVTGTFGNELNADIMLSSIKSSGYTAYQSSNQSLVRIGLKFDCVGIDLDSMLLSVRQTFSEKAWYLIPEYEPEF